jgi:hypothetical protein
MDKNFCPFLKSPMRILQKKSPVTLYYLCNHIIYNLLHIVVAFWSVMAKILIKIAHVRTRHRKISRNIYQFVTGYNAIIMKYPNHRKKTHNEEKRATFRLTIIF